MKSLPLLFNDKGSVIMAKSKGGADRTDSDLVREAVDKGYT